MPDDQPMTDGQPTSPLSKPNTPPIDPSFTRMTLVMPSRPEPSAAPSIDPLPRPVIADGTSATLEATTPSTQSDWSQPRASSALGAAALAARGADPGQPTESGSSDETTPKPVAATFAPSVAAAAETLSLSPMPTVARDPVASPSVATATDEPVDTPPAPVVMTSPSWDRPMAGNGATQPMPKFRLVAAGLVSVIILLAAGLVYGLYVPNTPERIFSDGLANTGALVDAYINYSRQSRTTTDRSIDFNGALQVQSPSGSFDFNLTGSADQASNVTTHLTTDVMGIKGSVDVRSVHVAHSTSPDVYLKVAGYKRLLDETGQPQLSKLDNRWLLIDHTLLNTYARGAASKATTHASDMPTRDQILDAATKVQAVNRQYIFTTDASKAVLTDQKFLGTVSEGGQALNHYRVGYDKDHLKAYVAALATALDDSSLNTWVKTTRGQTLSQVMNFDQLKQDVTNAKSDYTFELWVNTAARQVSKVTFVDPNNSKSIFTISMGQVSGSAYPVTLDIRSTDDSGGISHMTMTTTLNMTTGKIAVSLTGDDKAAAGTTTINLSMDFTPSTTTIKVTAPKGAQSITELLVELGLANQGSSSSSAPLFFQQ